MHADHQGRGKIVSADNITLCIQNTKSFTKNLLKGMNKFIKVMGYKINIQKSVEFQYITNKVPEKDIKNQPYLQ